MTPRKPPVKPVAMNLKTVAATLGVSKDFIRDIVSANPDTAPVFSPPGKPNMTLYKVPEFTQWFRREAAE